ncbi:MAG: DUF4931 domain-containing protein [bacterium]
MTIPKKYKNEIRKHYFLDKYVVVAYGRFGRPHDYMRIDKTKRVKRCHFCGDEDRPMILRYPETGAWKIKVIPNAFPAVSLENSSAYGKQEIVIETPVHNQEFSEMTINNIKNTLDVYQRRVEEILKVRHIKYVLVFKNDGPRSGASLSHSHSQIFAAEVMPPKISNEINGLKKYKQKRKTCAYCDIVKKERKSDRMIFADNHSIAFAPYASEYKLETWIVPVKHKKTISELTDNEKLSIAKNLKKILNRLDRRNFSYNLFFSNFIVNKKQDFHFVIKIQPRVNTWGGVELGCGIIFNSYPPERVPDFYRKNILE